MATDTDNPYSSPILVPEDAEAIDVSAEVDWKVILRRWELLRILFNGIVGVAGLFSITIFPPLPLEELIAGIVLYGTAANICYFFGPLAQLYINWFASSAGKRLLPKSVRRFCQSAILTWLLFIGGTLFSVGLTLLIGVLGALAGLGPLD